MGTDYKIANIDKHEYICPSELGDGTRLPGPKSLAVLMELLRREWGGDSITLVDDCSGHGPGLQHNPGEEDPYYLMSRRPIDLMTGKPMPTPWRSVLDQYEVTFYEDGLADVRARAER